MPFLTGHEPEKWRDYAVSEYDFSQTPMAMNLGLAQRDARLFMIADKRWKFMHSEGSDENGPYPPMLFDMENDPEEFFDLGQDPEYEEIIALMYERLGKWGRRMSQRTTLSDEQIIAGRGKSRRRGILPGAYEAKDVDPEWPVKYLGKAPQRPASGD